MKVVLRLLHEANKGVSEIITKIKILTPFFHFIEPDRFSFFLGTGPQEFCFSPNSVMGETFYTSCIGDIINFKEETLRKIRSPCLLLYQRQIS